MNTRVKTVVDDIIKAVQDVLIKHNVTFEEYRAGFYYLIDAAEKHEIPLMLDMFFNQTICDIEMKSREGSRSSVEGPYFLEGASEVTDRIKVSDRAEPLLIRAEVRDLQGNPIPDVLVDLWWSDPDGYYSGYTDDLPIEYYRGKVRTDDQGRLSVMGSVPEEYPMTRERHGPVGNLIEMLGGQGMRPKHVHQKYRKEGYKMLTTQTYFRGENYLDDDPVKAVFDELCQDLKEENGVKVLDLDIVLDPAD